MIKNDEHAASVMKRRVKNGKKGNPKAVSRFLKRNYPNPNKRIRAELDILADWFGLGK